MHRTYEFIIDGEPQGRMFLLDNEYFLMPEGFGAGNKYGDTPDKIEYHNNHTSVYLSTKGNYANA